jgi:guanylate kinase
MERGDVFVISAPSGSGKTTICRMLVQRLEDIELSISYTTRLRRQGEVEGKDYYFIEREKFDKMIISREFLEYASVYGHLYGTSREAVRSIVSRGRDVVLEIDVQGGRKVKGELPEAFLIAVFPPDRRSLEKRLIGRGRDSTEEVKARLRAADGESEELLAYDYLVVNDDLEAAVNRVAWIVRAARLRRERALIRLTKRYNETGEGNHGESDR